MTRIPIVRRASGGLPRMLLRALLAMFLVGACSAESSGPAGGAASIELVTGVAIQQITAGEAVPQLPTLRVVDAGGRGVPGVRLRTYTSSGPIASISFTASQTDDDGLVSFASWVPGTVAGEQVVEVEEIGGDAALQLRLTIVPGAPTREGISHDTLRIPVGALSAPVGIVSFDAYDNIVALVEPGTLTIHDETLVSVEAGSRLRGESNGRTVIEFEGAALADTIFLVVGPRTISEVTTYASGPSLALAVAASGRGYVQANLPNAPLVAFDSAFTTFTPTARVSEYNPVLALIRGETQVLMRGYAGGSTRPYLYAVSTSTHAVADSLHVPYLTMRATETPGGTYALTFERYSFDDEWQVARHTLATNERVELLDSRGVGGIYGFALHPSQPLVYFSRRTGQVQVLNYATGEVDPPVDVSCQANGIALDAAANLLYVTCMDGPLQLRNATTFALIRENPAVSRGFDVKISRSGTRVYVSRHDQSRVVILTKSIEHTLEEIVGVAPRWIEVHPEGFLFTAEIVGPLRLVREP